MKYFQFLHRSWTPCHLAICHYVPLQSVTDRVRSALEAEFEVSGLQLTAPTFFSRIAAAQKPRQANDEYWHAHVDREQYGAFDFTALIYLSEFGEHFEGGQFAFVDAGAEALTVEPREGRTVLFTSGAENVHKVHRVSDGVRLAFTVAFTCDPAKGVQDFLQNSVF